MTTDQKNCGWGHIRIYKQNGRKNCVRETQHDQRQYSMQNTVRCGMTQYAQYSLFLNNTVCKILIQDGRVCKNTLRFGVIQYAKQSDLGMIQNAKILSDLG